MIEESIKRTVKLPEGFSAAIDGSAVTIKSSKGELSQGFSTHGVSFKVEGNSIMLEGRPASRKMNAILRTIASHIENMISGLQNVYQYRLAVVYSHFPMSIAVKGREVEINNFMGEKHPRVAKILPNVTVELKGKEVLVKSTDKNAAGQTAANLEKATKVRGKDRRIYQDGIFIVEKAKQGEEGEKKAKNVETEGATGSNKGGQ